MFTEHQNVNRQRLLIIDDEEPIRMALQEALVDSGFDVILAESGETGLHVFRTRGPFDLVVTDYKMPGLNGFDVLKEVRRLSAKTPVIMMTGHGSVHHAVNAIQEGASDYLCKPFSVEDLERVIKKALPEIQQTLSQDLITQDPKMIMIVRKAERAAKSDTPILIEGPSGTGKELLARRIHESSSRAEKAWVAVNCAALPAGLLESELFGYEKGAFTGAVERKTGKFEMANGGTLLLDEIGELDPILQAKLLRVLQEGEIDRLGGKKPIKVDVRIIATTNRNLARLVSEDRFREDLFYRLYGVRFELPALRERPRDIEILAAEFLDRQSTQLGRRLTYASGVIEYLQSQPWQGNIRELERAVERAAVLSEGPFVTIEDFEFAPHESPKPTSVHVGSSSLVGSTTTRSSKPMKEMERDTILSSLESHGGNRTHTAKALGMSLRTLRHKLKVYREGGFDTRQDRQREVGKNVPSVVPDATLVAFNSSKGPGLPLAPESRGEDYR